MPKRPIKARNTPGAAKSAQKGSINQFRHLSNATPQKGTAKGLKGRMICWRRGSPDHPQGDCPRPYTPDLFGTKGKGKGEPNVGKKGELVHFMADQPHDANKTPANATNTEEEEESNNASNDVNGGENRQSETMHRAYPEFPEVLGYDHYASYYTQRAAANLPLYFPMVVTAEHDMLPAAREVHKNCHGQPKPATGVPNTPPVLVGSGASDTVVGKA